MPFRWNAANIEHIARHGVRPPQAEQVIRSARSPYPRAIEDDKYLVHGQSEDGTYLQVIFIYSPRNLTYVIHARPLTDREKHNFRRHRS